MKTPPTTPPRTSLPDWLNDCSFHSRQDSLGLTPGILAHHVKKSASPEPSHRDFASGTGVTALGEHGLVSITNPPSQRDFLPEVILFGLIGVLCAAWPIFSMFTAMAGRH